jgi:hypothetical protein
VVLLNARAGVAQAGSLNARATKTPRTMEMRL